TTAAAHARRADALTAGRRFRAARGLTHPIDDFLYTYYSYKPSLLRRWHPGAGVVLADAPERAGWRWYRADGDGVSVDAAAFRAERAVLLRAIGGILHGALSRNPRLGCFGLHEWAMVYREPETRHAVPLRLGATGTDAVVEAHELHCTHLDAFRFFTPSAAPRNATVLSRAGQAAAEQPGCLHANMDLYKWAVKLGPLVPGDLLLDAFELARDIRVVDMRASPYDLREWGYAPIEVETDAGKREYIARQRGFAERARPLRAALLQIAGGQVWHRRSPVRDF
ncbi:MAG: 3-methyladenine DNA glycosylase, partial [Microbacterium sp.]|uniref:3-methyladenine DNA glycosylase n=1 Tax=Microbacterium sp. TaxID=51671 RepID=UPI0039E53158